MRRKLEFPCFIADIPVSLSVWSDQLDYIHWFTKEADAEYSARIHVSNTGHDTEVLTEDKVTAMYVGWTLAGVC